MAWSTFTRYMNENKSSIRKSVWGIARREGIERYKERMLSGYAAYPLDFSDLITRCEDSLTA